MGRALVSSAEIFAVVYESSGDARRIAAADTAALPATRDWEGARVERRNIRGGNREQFFMVSVCAPLLDTSTLQSKSPILCEWGY
jgi:hypothetical protein